MSFAPEACPLTLISNKYLEQMYLDGNMSLELVPQGTLAERMRAHGAGIPAFFTPTGASTTVETGGIPIRFNAGGFKDGVKIPGNKKEIRMFDGKRYVMEPAIAGDVAFVHAWKADEAGNLVFRCVWDWFSPAADLTLCFRYVANNYNNVMARNAKLTIVEVHKERHLSVVLLIFHAGRRNCAYRQPVAERDSLPRYLRRQNC